MSEQPKNRGDTFKDNVARSVRNADRKKLGELGTHFSALYKGAVQEAQEANATTRSDEGIAQMVAGAIKPDVDYVQGLQKRIDSPLAGSVYDAKTGVVGSEDIESLQVQQTAGKLDLEINSVEATNAAKALNQLGNRPPHHS